MRKRADGIEVRRLRKESNQKRGLGEAVRGKGKVRRRNAVERQSKEGKCSGMEQKANEAEWRACVMRWYSLDVLRNALELHSEKGAETNRNGKSGHEHEKQRNCRTQHAGEVKRNSGVKSCGAKDKL